MGWSAEDIKKKGLVEVGGVYVKVNSLVSKKVEKQPDLLEQGRNKKIMNAKKSTNDAGVHFDSLLEQHMYDLLQGAGIDFEFQKVYELQPKFKYNGKTARAVKMIVDFWVDSHNLIIDTKGFATAISTLKYKMLMNKFIIDRFGMYEVYRGARPLPKIEMPRTKDECNLLLNRILFDK